MQKCACTELRSKPVLSAQGGVSVISLMKCAQCRRGQSKPFLSLFLSSGNNFYVFKLHSIDLENSVWLSSDWERGKNRHPERIIVTSQEE